MKKKAKRLFLSALAVGVIAGGTFLAMTDIPAPTKLKIVALDSSKYIK